MPTKSEQLDHLWKTTGQDLKDSLSSLAMRGNLGGMNEEMETAINKGHLADLLNSVERVEELNQ